MRPTRRGLVVAVVGLGLLGLLLYARRRAGRDPNEMRAVSADRATGVKVSPGSLRSSAAAEGSAGDERRRVRAGHLRGRVLDGTGRPVPRATVCAQGYSDKLSDDDLGQPTCIVANDNGSYDIGGLPAARYRLDASARNHQPGRHRRDRREMVALAVGESKDGLDIVLPGGGVEIHGRVKDIGGGPVAQALVIASPGGFAGWEAASAHTTTDDGGNFHAFVAPGTISVSASARGYVAGNKSAVAPGAFVEVLLTPEAVLMGQVIRTGNGEPVAGAVVRAGPVEMMDWGSNRSAQTDSEGKFRIERLSPGRYKPSASTPEGSGQAATTVLLGLAGHAAGVVIEMHAAVTVAGHVVLSDGKKPCPRGWIRLFDRKTQRNGSAGVEPDGSFSVPGVLAGQYAVMIDCEGQANLTDTQLVTVKDKSISGLRFVLPASQSVRGSIVRADGRGVANAQLWLTNAGGDPRGQRRYASAQTQTDGTFVLAGVTSGTYVLHIESDAAPKPPEPPPLTVPDGRDLEGVRIVLPPENTVTGVVVDQDDRPVKSADIYASSADEAWGWRHTLSRDDGGFVFEGLRDGEHRIAASRNSALLRAPGSTDDDLGGVKVTLKGGAPKTVRLVVMRETGVIKGRVMQGGKPVTDAFVDAERESESASAGASEARLSLRGGWSRQPAITDVDGGFEIKDLTQGRYAVRAFRKGGGEALAEHAAVGAFITLTIAATGTLAGTVAVEGGGVPESFSITVADAKEGFSLTESFWRTAGVWKMTDLPAGKHRVLASAPEGTATVEAPLTEGQARTGVAVVLTPKARVRGQFVTLDGKTPVPGMKIIATPRGQNRFEMGNDGPDRRDITDAQGRFELDDAPAGRIHLTAFPIDWTKRTCGWGRVRANLKPNVQNDLGTLRCAPARTKPNEPVGDLGFSIKSADPDPDDPPHVFTVAVIRPDGPATGSGLKIGDVITSIDGHDITGDNDYLYFGLAQVPVGANVKLGLKTGNSVSIKAGPPP